MNTSSGFFRLSFAVASGVLALISLASARAQSADAQPSPPQTVAAPDDRIQPASPIVPGAALASAPSAVTRPATRPVAPVPGGDPVLMEERGRTFFYSVSLGSGYDTAVDDIPDLSGGLTMLEGYGGLFVHRPHFALLLQQDSKVSRSIQTGIGFEQYQLTTASLAGEKSRRTNWSALVENGYGSDAARSIGSISSAVLDAAVVSDPNLLGYTFLNGDTLTDHAMFSVAHRLSKSRTLDIKTGGYFHHYYAYGTSDQQYSLSTGIRQQFSDRQSFGVEADGVQQNFESLNCTNASLGLNEATRLARNTRIEGSAGPVWGTKACTGTGITYQYAVTLTTGNARNVEMYLGSARQPSDGLINEATWEETDFGGFSLGRPTRVQALVDAGYAAYLLAQPTPTNPNLRGYFVSGELDRRLSNIADLSLTVRHFAGGPPLSQLNRTFFMVTYTWSREQRPARIRSYGVSNDSH
ncbi:MAG: hypothetical protein ACYCSN_01340 [Acidobacteriaceae bacterium]